jgi:uncharacterized protein YfaS (alpha-2-macroglobulin family)
VITDKNGKAQVKFTLPDNLTNFRVMVVANSKDNHFGYSEKFIGVRKNVIAEDRTPLILRSGDNATIGANIFNNSSEDLNFKVTLNTYETSFLEFCSSCIPEQNISLKAGESKFVSWDRIIPVARDEIKYTISVI